MMTPKFFIALALASLAGVVCAEVRVPAFTGYADPDANGARFSQTSGVTGWRDPKNTVSWFGDMKEPATIEATLEMRLPADATSKLRLSVAGQSRDVEVKGAGTNVVTAKFGRFEIKEPGYQRFTLTSLNPAGQPNGDLSTLVLDGVTTNNTHFNYKSRRNAASVHLSYPSPKGTNVAAFYCEMTGVEDTIPTYYMACGWHRGYFGMQINSATERRIIFSVWDSGNEAISRSKVADSNRVTLVAKGEGVYSGDFGNEGTGGHSHLKYLWKTGEKQRFIVTAQPTNNTFTIFSGYWFHPEKKEWMLISSWKAPKDGGWLRGLYSFSEDFGGSRGHLPRKALYGNQWIRTDTGAWHEVTTASFSHDVTGRADRLDRFMGVENGQFFLHHGGFVNRFTKFGEKFGRPAVGRIPELPPFVFEVPTKSPTGASSQPQGRLERTGKFAGWLDRHEKLLARTKGGGVDLAFLGDSITENWEKTGKEVWARHYAQRRAANYGVGGDSTEHVLWRLDHGEFDGISPKVCVLLIGTNNARHSEDSPEQIAAGVRTILSRLESKCPQTKVLLLGILPRGANPEDPWRQRCDQINRLLPALADAKRVHFLDIGSAFIQPDGSISKSIMPDYLHLSALGYSRWAKAMEPKLQELLGEI